MPVIVSFLNYIVEIKCLNLLLSSQFEKILNESGVQKIEETLCFLVVDVSITEEVQPIFRFLVSTPDLMTRIVHGETETEFEVAYTFTLDAKHMLENIHSDRLLELMLIFDCLDIKSTLLALIHYVCKKDHSTFDECIARIRAKRYTSPNVQIRDFGPFLLHFFDA